MDPEFPDIPAALNNVTDLGRLLTSPSGGALARSQCSILTNPEHNTQVGKAVASAAKEADDVLLVYFAGHGVVDKRGRLNLALTGTSQNHPEWSSVPFATLREELIASPARARILILDCCFSGRAFEAMGTKSSLVDGQIDIQGTYTIASSAKNEPSIAPEGHRHTAFTAALLSAATEPDLTLDQLYRKVDQTLHRDGYPRPQRRSVNIAGELRLFTPPSLRPKSGADASIAPIINSPTDSGSNGDALFESGQHFCDVGDLSQAEVSWRQSASQGHTGAMNNLANMLFEQGQAREAHVWYREAAQRGNINAMGNLAILLHQIQQLRDAELWWRRAAEAGNTDAMYNLAVMLDKSLHYDEAITWYRQAADADHTDAMHNLAIRLRYRGQLSEAITWWHRAGHQRAQHTKEKPRGLTSRRQSQRGSGARGADEESQ